jgi:xanthine dehydrogenase small subunit
VHAAADIQDSEIAPIDDVRGSARYKRIAARRILFAHALKAAPDLLSVEAFV